MEDLIKKYNIPTPRYTSYPTVPEWDKDAIDQIDWLKSVKLAFSESNTEGLSIYIHLPFCESMCTFCGCHKRITKQHDLEEPYIDALIKEWQLYLKQFDEIPLIKEIHLGGGTPTFFQPERLEKLIRSLLDSSKLADEYEFSFEGHPNNTTREHLLVLYDLGFRRVSFGVQDYNPIVQKAINRIQPFENVKECHDMARQIGYTSISHDLVYGLPMQHLNHILKTIDLTHQLMPDRISLYSYAHVPWIKGVGQRGFKDEDLPTGHEKRQLYEGAKTKLLEQGYFEIGMDHFGLNNDPLLQALRQKKLHRNFMGYTTNSTRMMIGLGMSAISDSWFAFAQNSKSVEEYTEIINNGQLAIQKGHKLTKVDLIVRKHILNLMCHNRTSVDPTTEALQEYDEIKLRLDLLQKDGLIERNGVDIRVTEIGQKFVRNVCTAFDIRLHAKELKTQRFSLSI